MTTNDETRSTEVVAAIADTIVTYTSILQTSTVATGVGGTIVGATDLPLASASGFTDSGYIQFFDNTGELMTAIASITSNTLHLNYNGYVAEGLPVGLVSAHLDGAIVATNLMLHRPMLISPMLRTGKPVVCIWPTDGVVDELATMETVSPVTIHLQVHLSVISYDASPIDPEVLSLFRQQSCQSYLFQIQAALDRNRHLRTQYNDPDNHAIRLGNRNEKGWMKSTFKVFDDKETDIPQAIAAADIIVWPRQFLRDRSVS